MDLWNPEQYKKFQAERARPFWDLAQKVDFNKVHSMLDIGCGSGELTKALHVANDINRTVGIDSSANMLEQAKAEATRGLSFEVATIETYHPVEKFDLVFSNAALQWVPEHESLFHHMLTWLKPDGQLAVQMPFNHEHPSHVIAEKVAVTAEHYRKELAIEWLGETLPNWSKRCLVRVKVGQVGAGGATTFSFGATSQPTIPGSNTPRNVISQSPTPGLAK